MNKISFLDCTLRDGGYYSNWDFDNSLVETYYKAFEKLPVNYLEIGYRAIAEKGYLGEYFYCPDYVIDNARKLSSKKLSIMLNEKSVKPEHVPGLLGSAIGKIDLVRLAVDPENIVRALKLAEEIKKLKFEVSFNMMYMSKWKTHTAFLNNLGIVNGIIDYFYIVDSYGGSYPSEVADTFNLVKERVKIPIGFHGHNNLEMALINSLTAIECGAEMIDATITGMGRGAGNLKTELLLTALNAKGKLEVDFNTLSDLTHAFETLQDHFKWGTNLPYMVSGANSLPQKDVMDWVSKRFFSYNSIIRALHNQKFKSDDKEQFSPFAPDINFEKVLIVGGGPSVKLHIKAIRQFIDKNQDMAIVHASSRNAALLKDIIRRQYFCLVGNEGTRLEKAFDDLGVFDGECLLPAFPRKMGTYVPEKVINKTRELQKAEFGDHLADTHTALALQTALQLGAVSIYLIGYDGYPQAMVSNREMEIFNENESLFSKFRKHTSISIVSLTPTLYKELVSDSVYAKI
jgi:4-hydroxy 2-oxovalerate aldolase